VGGLAALRLIEESPRSFDAAIATCRWKAPKNGLDSRFLLAYAAVFGWPDPWGAVNDVRAGLNFARDVNPIVPWPKPNGK